MKYQGNPIFATPPATCSYAEADCPEHGFGLDFKRAKEIANTIAQHADDCRDKAVGTVDFPKFMAGPDLDLQTPTEVLFAGYCIDRNSIALRQWVAAVEAYKSAQQQEGLGNVTNGLSGGSVMFNFGQSGPIVD